MAHNKGVDLGGINSLERIRLRCYCPEESGCWIWKGAYSKTGTPMANVSLNGEPHRKLNTRRAALLLEGRASFSNKTDIWATTKIDCKNPKHCVNPAHLRWATRSQALRNASARGAFKSRAMESMVSSFRKLTSMQVDAIKRRGEADRSMENYKALAAEYGVHFSTIKRIVYRCTYINVTQRAVNSVFDLGRLAA